MKYLVWLSLLFAFPISAEETAKTATQLNLLAEFVSFCMDPGPLPDEIKRAILEAGGKAVHIDPNKAPNSSQLENYYVKRGTLVFFVVFNKAATCSVLSPDADLEATRESLEDYSSAKNPIFEIGPFTKSESAPGETVVLAKEFHLRTSEFRFTVTLSSVLRPGRKPIVFLSREMLP